MLRLTAALRRPNEKQIKIWLASCERQSQAFKSIFSNPCQNVNKERKILKLSCQLIRRLLPSALPTACVAQNRRRGGEREKYLVNTANLRWIRTPFFLSPLTKRLPR